MLLDLLEPLFEKKKTDALQKKAWDQLKANGLPTKKWEAFRYVPLKKLFETTELLEVKARIEYPQQSDIVILPVEEAKNSYAPLLERRYIRIMENEKDPFFLLNHALHDEALFIYVPPGVQVKEPLPLKLLIEASENMSFIQPKIEIFLGKGSSLTTMMSLDSQATSFWNNANMNVTIEENASYSHYDLTRAQPEAWDFLSFRAQLKRMSRLHFFSYQRGARILRRDLHVSLEGEGSKAHLNGIALLNDKLEGHVHIRVDHAAPHAISHQFFKNVLSDQARSSFEGKIFVEKEAQKTEAYQLNNNLLLSKNAAAFSKPNLEILADDVKASHGATVSQPQQEELFYLRSRGLSEEEAERHLVRGFCRELIQQIPDPILQSQLSGDVDGYL